MWRRIEPSLASEDKPPLVRRNRPLETSTRRSAVPVSDA